MSCRRGDILLADIAYSDRSGAKRRPALVVSADANNAVLDDIILVAISSTSRSGAFTHVLVDPATPDGHGSGLLHPSFLQCENIFTLDQQFIVRDLGRLSFALMQQVNDCLRAALQLP
jgi:mRNA-degrading endonuclease toxin of MazEF toxin-antitoxin module